MELIPKKPRSRSFEAQLDYREKVESFCDLILRLRGQMDFSPSSRGWCYILEEHGLTKGDFGKASDFINDLRKSGDLPISICSRDGARATEGVLDIDGDVESEVDRGVATVEQFHEWYRPFSFWEGRDIYLEIFVEKIDLKYLFKPVCDEYYIPITNLRGWGDVNSRYDLLERMKARHDAGARCVILYCGDHDPGGLAISKTLPKNLRDLEGAMGWNPDEIEVDHFGLSYQFIKKHRLSWIDNLETSSGKRLDNPKHPDHAKAYVQDYLRQFGARKVEANALIVRPDAGRKLMREAIEKYVTLADVAEYEARVDAERESLREELIAALQKKFAA